MQVTENNIKDNVTVFTTTVCDIVFCLFTYLYLYAYQCNLLAAVQSALSGGTTTYNRTIGAVIITALLYALKRAVATWTRRFSLLKAYPAFNVFPSAILLAFLTDANPENACCYNLAKWAWLLPLTLIAVYAAIYVLGRIENEEQKEETVCPLANTLWRNGLVVLSALLYVCIAANTDRDIHNRLTMEASIISGNYNDAIVRVKKTSAADPSSGMLRAYALACEGKLGERLFEHAPEGGSGVLLPDGKSARCLLMSDAEILKGIGLPRRAGLPDAAKWQKMRKRGLCKASLRDYELCEYLLDKDIDRFAEAMLAYRLFDINRQPKHYREAMVLYTHMRSNPIMKYENAVMEADYQEFMNIIKQTTDPAQRKSTAEASYGTTYWFYFFYGKNKK